MSSKYNSRAARSSEAVVQDRFPMVKISMLGALMHPASGEHETCFILLSIAAYTINKVVGITRQYSTVKHGLPKGKHDQTERTTGLPK